MQKKSKLFNKMLLLLVSLVTCVSFSSINGMDNCPDNCAEQSLFASGGEDTKIKVWSAAVTSFEQAKLGTIGRHYRPVNSLQFSPDGALLASSTEGIIKLWDTSDNNHKKWRLNEEQLYSQIDLHAKTILALAFHPKKKFLVSGSGHKTIRTWNLKTMRFRETVPMESEPSEITINSDNSLIAAASLKGSLTVWDMEKGTHLGRLAKHTESINSLSLHPTNDQLLVSGSQDGTIKLWDVKAMRLLRTLHEQSKDDPIVSVKVTPGTNKILFATEKNLNILDLKKISPVITVIGKIREQFCSMAVSQNGDYVVLGDSQPQMMRYSSGQIRILNLKNMEITTFPAHTEAVLSLAFKPQQDIALEKRLQEEELERVQFMREITQPDTQAELEGCVLVVWKCLLLN